MLDQVDRGAVADETPEMAGKREAMLAKSPPPTFFKLRAQMLKQGRSNQVVAATEHLKLGLKVYAGGGENGLHNHSDEDHIHLILQGSAVFFGPRGEELHCGQYEGILLPRGSFYRFQATSEEPLVLAADVGQSAGQVRAAQRVRRPTPQFQQGQRQSAGDRDRRPILGRAGISGAKDKDAVARASAPIRLFAAGKQRKLQCR